MNHFFMMTLFLLAGFVTEVNAEASQDEMQKMLDQLEQLEELDRQEFNRAIDKGYECADKNNFSCVDREIRAARSLVFDKVSEKSLEKLVSYRKKQEEYFNEEKRIAAQIKREEECANRCPISREYSQCIAGKMDAYYCREERSANRGNNSSNGSNSTLAAFSMALSQMNTQMQADLARQKADFEQQMKQYEAQREREKRQKQQRLAEQRRRQQQQQANLASLQQAQERERQEALRRRQQEEARRLAREEREREREARRLAKQREKEQEAANKLAYLESLKSGARLGARICSGGNHVFGLLPTIRPKLVGCVNIHFSIQCSSSGPVQHQGVLSNHVNLNAGSCIGDTVQVPKLSCPVSQYVVKATSVVGC